MFPVVALDLETTGLDSLHDAIIEIGAVKYDGSQIVGKWQSLINPQRMIPAPITQLTGITNEMVRDAPPIKAVIQDFADFVGDSPVVGHNVRFDLGFLKIQHDFSRNPVNDTFEIAAVLLPSAPRYSLSALVDTLQVSNLQPHRAQEDAEATLAVCIRLFEKASELSTHLIAEIVQDAQSIDWDANYFFTQVLRNRSKQAPQARHTGQQDYGTLFSQPSELLAQPLKPNPTILPLDVEETTAILSPEDLFQSTCPISKAAMNSLKCCKPSPKRFPTASI
jgi:DNA polymerase-3 subunit epsilon/ATP-dependent DNA helicase DinG